MDYRAHQRRLLPLLARTYALHFIQARDGRATSTRSSAAPRRDEEARRAPRDEGGRRQGLRDLARDRVDPDRARGLRRARLPDLDRLRCPQGRRRDLRHLRGRQHRPAAARRQEPADRLPGGVRRPRPARHGRLHRLAGDRALRRALRRARALGPDLGRDHAELGGGRRPQPPRVPAGAVRLARGPRPLQRGPPAQGRHRRRLRPLRGLQRLPGPRPRRRPLAHRPRDPRGLQPRRRRVRGRSSEGAARPALRPLRAQRDRASTAAGTRSTAASHRPARRP